MWRRIRPASPPGVLTSALQIGAAISVAGIGSLFFAVLGQGTGRDAYAHAFGVAQAATTRRAADRDAAVDPTATQGLKTRDGDCPRLSTVA